MSPPGKQIANCPITGCGLEARVCPECVRDLAARLFWGAARHPDPDAYCQLCNAGEAMYCADCALDQASLQRASLRHTQIGARLVATWPHVDPLGTGKVARGMDMAAGLVEHAANDQDSPEIRDALQLVAASLKERAWGMSAGLQAVQAQDADPERTAQITGLLDALAARLRPETPL